MTWDMADFRRKIVPPKGHPFVRFIFEEINRQRASLAQVAERSGVTADGIRKWRDQRGPRLGLVEAVLEALGYELVIREKRPREDH